MLFVAYDKALALDALARAAAGASLTVGGYNAAIALLAGLRDYVYDAENMGRGGRASFPTVAAPSMPGEDVRAPVVGLALALPVPDVSPPLATPWPAVGTDAHGAELTLRRAELGAALAEVMRRLRSSLRLAPDDPHATPSGALLVGYTGPLAVTGEAADALAWPGTLPASQRVVVDPLAARTALELLGGVAVIATSLGGGGDVAPGHGLFEITVDERASLEEARWLSRAYAARTRGREIVATVVGVALLLTTLRYASRGRK